MPAHQRFTPPARGAADQRPWLAAALLALGLVAVADGLTHHVALTSLLILGPLIASLRLRPRDVALIGVLAIGLGLLAFDFDKPGGGTQHLVRVCVVTLGSALAVLISLARTRLERDRAAERLMAQLAAARPSDPGVLAPELAAELVPAFADGAAITLAPWAGGTSGASATAGVDPADRPDAEVVRRGLQADGRELGELRLTRSRFAPDSALLDRVARYLALTLENAVLMAELREEMTERRRNEEDLRTVSRRLEDERARLQTVMDQLPAALVIRDEAGTPIAMNPRARALRQEISDSDEPERWFLAHPGRRPDGAVLEPEHWPSERALRGEVVEGEEFEIERADGTWTAVRSSAAPVYDADGRIVASVSIFNDISENARDRRAMSWLAAAGRLLDRLHTLEQHVAELLAVIVNDIADAGIVVFANPDGTITSGRVVAPDQDLEARLEPLARPERVGVDPAHPLARALREREPVRVHADDPDGDAEAAWLAAEGFASAFAVPLQQAGHVLGGFLVLSERRRILSEREESTIELAGRRAALALDNARLYAEQHRIATALQRDLLPRALPEWEGLELAALYRPAQGDAADVGGDFYDLFESGGGRLIVIGDVSGKGVEAAATTALVRHAVRTAAQVDATLAERLAIVNEAIVTGAPRTQFCTIAMALLTPAAGGAEAEVICAGHPPPLVRRANGEVEAVPAEGTLLGLFEDLTFSSVRVTLAPDDVLVLFTDGVTEARLPDGSLFGSEGLADVLAKSPSHDPGTLLDQLDGELDRRRAGARDDVAIVLARVLP